MGACFRKSSAVNTGSKPNPQAQGPTQASSPKPQAPSPEPQAQSPSPPDAAALMQVDGVWVRRSDDEEWIIDGEMLRSSGGWFAKVSINNGHVYMKGIELLLRGGGKQMCLAHDLDYILDRSSSLGLTPSFGQQDLEASILKGDVALVRGSYFEKCWRDGKRYEMRQLVPQEDQWSGADVVKLWNKYGRMFLVIISYAWLSAGHPDPNRFHLQPLDRIVRELRAQAAEHGLDDIAVAVDYCSLWQKNADGSDERSPEQRQQFGDGLGAFNMFYVHGDVTGVKMMSTPPEEPRTYNDRGWPLLESVIIDSKAGHISNRMFFDNSFDPDTEVAQGVDFVKTFGTCGQRHPPLTPERFNAELEGRGVAAEAKGLPLFTNGSDYSFVEEKYAKLVESLQHAESLQYESCNWGDSEVLELCDVLHISRIGSLNLRYNHMTEGALGPLVSSLTGNKTVKYLLLDDNNIGEAGAGQLAELAMETPSLRRLEMGGNPVCLIPEAMRKIQEAWRVAGKDETQLKWGTE